MDTSLCLLTAGDGGPGDALTMACRVRSSRVQPGPSSCMTSGSAPASLCKPPLPRLSRASLRVLLHQHRAVGPLSRALTICGFSLEMSQPCRQLLPKLGACSHFAFRGQQGSPSHSAQAPGGADACPGQHSQPGTRAEDSRGQTSLSSGFKDARCHRLLTGGTSALGCGCVDSPMVLGHRWPPAA